MKHLQTFENFLNEDNSHKFSIGDYVDFFDGDTCRIDNVYFSKSGKAMYTIGCSKNGTFDVDAKDIDDSQSSQDDTDFLDLQNLSQNKEEMISNLGPDAEDDEIRSVKLGFRAIVNALGESPEDIVCLNDFTDNYDPIIVGHPDLANDEAWNFNDYYSKTQRGLSKEIWQDEVWLGSPGSNQIYVHECPTVDGGTIKVAEWNGSNWDYPWIYIKRSDLNKRLAL
jgi:hypothetical protein